MYKKTQYFRLAENNNYKNFYVTLISNHLLTNLIGDFFLHIIFGKFNGKVTVMFFKLMNLD